MPDVSFAQIIFHVLVFGMKYQLKVLPVILLIDIVLQKACQAHSKKCNNEFILADDFVWLKNSGIS